MPAVGCFPDAEHSAAGPPWFLRCSMTDKELRRLSRSELLEMLIRQTQENEKLSQELQQCRAELDERRITAEKAGSIAQAALKLNGVFEAAQAAADQYVASVQQMNSDQIREETRRQVEGLVVKAQQYDAKLRTEADAYSQKTRAEADAYSRQVRTEADAYSQKTRTEAEDYSLNIRGKAIGARPVPPPEPKPAPQPAAKTVTNPVPSPEPKAVQKPAPQPAAAEPGQEQKIGRLNRVFRRQQK